jgi:hypothetical protein
MVLTKKSLVALAPFFILIPYLGNKDLNNFIIGFGFLFFSALSFCVLSSFSSIDKIIKNLLIIFLVQFCFISFSILQSSLFLGIIFTANDLVEVIRPLLNVFIILPIYYFYERSGYFKSIKYLKNWIIAFTIFNFILSVVSKFDLTILKPLVESYAEGPIYSFGYSKFRAFGLIGQPGKNAIFCNLLVLALIYLNKINKSKIILGFIILNGMSIILTLSRVGLLIYIFIISINYINFNTIKKYFLSILIIVIGLAYFLYYLSLDFFDFNLLLRGIDDGGSKLGTLGKRLYLKQWSFDVISQNINSLLFGVGPCKDYLASLTTTFADDLTLRHPDSSFTLWMLRYGFIGLVLFYLPHIKMLFSKRKFLIQTVAIILVISNLDPPYNEPKTQVLYWLIILFLLKFENLKKQSFKIYNNE